MDGIKNRKLKYFISLMALVFMIVSTIMCVEPKSNLDISNASLPIENSQEVEQPSNEPTSSWYSYRNSSQITGNGSVALPWTIYTPGNLAYIAYMIQQGYSQYISGHYKLMSDLDMNNYYWVPITTFSGVFDGNFKTIKNLILTDSSATSSGGFGLFDTVTGGTIKNLGVKINYSFGLNAGLGSYTGALVGLTRPDSNITIEKCWTSGNMVVESEKPMAYVGSIIGYASTTTSGNHTTVVRDCFSDLTINVFSATSDVYVGGMFGHFDPATTLLSANVSKITAANLIFRGELAVYRNTKTPVISGIVAHLASEPVNGQTHSISNSYYCSTKLGNATAVEKQADSNFSNVGGLTDNMLTKKDNLVGFDFDNVWEHEPYIEVDPEKKLMPRLKGFNYPETQYVILTFILDDQPYAIRYVQKGFPFSDFPLLPDKGDGTSPGWSSRDTEGRYYDFNACMYSASFEAVYIEQSHLAVVTYMAYGQKGIEIKSLQVITSLNIKKGYCAMRIPPISIAGYTFSEWYADANLTIKYDWSKVITGNTVIYAKYVPNRYTITIYDGTEVINRLTVNHGETISSFSPPDKEGYTYEALFRNDKFTGSAYTLNSKITSSFSLYIKYTPNPVTVTFHYEGPDPDTGIWGSLETVVNLFYDETIAPEDYPQPPLKQGYDKTNPIWLHDNQEWDTETPVTDNIDLYAQYTLNTYTVSFMYPELIRDVVTSQGKTMLIKEEFVQHGSNVVAPTDVEVGSFAGYKRATPKWDNQNFTNITADKVFVAQFEISAFKVVFKGNGEEVSFDVEPGHSFDVSLIPTPPRKPGYDQTPPEWDLDGVDFENIIGDIEINAIYTINEYTVTYIMPDGTSTELKVDHGGSISTPPTFDIGLFEKLVYSAEAQNVVQDMTIEVSIQNYAYIAYIFAGGVALLGVVLLLIKLLRNKKPSVSSTFNNRLR